VLAVAADLGAGVNGASARTRSTTQPALFPAALVDGMKVRPKQGRELSAEEEVR
jgi:hypothetical protein